MAVRDNLYRPDEQKERDRMLAKEDAKIRAKVARRRAKSSRVSDKDIENRKDALKKAQPLTPYKRVIRSKKTQEGAVARLRAKQEGRKAAVRIAKARALKKKKAPVTREATRLNDAGVRLRKYANRRLDVASLQTKYSIISKTPDRSRTTATAKAKMKLYEPDSPAVQRYNLLETRASKLQRQSKVVARKSGGLATAMKRNAEAGIEHIVRGRALKGAARVGGVLGIASLFAQHLGGKDKKNG